MNTNLTAARSSVARIKNDLSEIDVLMRELEEALSSAEATQVPSETVPLPPHRI